MPRQNPLAVFCFMVEIEGESEASAFFKSVGGLKMETEVVPVRAGGVNDTTFQLIGATKWSNIVLKRGFTGSSSLSEWRNSWLSPGGKRKTVTIKQLDYKVNEKIVKATWKIHRAWPCKWEINEFDASKSELSIETLELAHEGISFG